MCFRCLYIFSVVFLLTSWAYRESTTAANSPVASQQSEDTKSNPMDDSIAVEKIAFYSNRSGNVEIYIMNTDGTGLKRLTMH